MDDEIKDVQESEQHTDYKPSNRFDAAAVHHLSGMYQNWFLDYASYVILERAVPHLAPGAADGSRVESYPSRDRTKRRTTGG